MNKFKKWVLGFLLIVVVMSYFSFTYCLADGPWTQAAKGNGSQNADTLLSNVETNSYNWTQKIAPLIIGIAWFGAGILIVLGIKAGGQKLLWCIGGAAVLLSGSIGIAIVAGLFQAPK